MRVSLEVEKEIEREKIAAYVVSHLPIVKAYAVKIGIVDIINQLIPSKMDVDPGTIFLGMVIDQMLCMVIFIESRPFFISKRPTWYCQADEKIAYRICGIL